MFREKVNTYENILNISRTETNMISRIQHIQTQFPVAVETSSEKFHRKLSN